MTQELLPVRNGLKPGDVGYDGYDLNHYDGVFEREEEGAVNIDQEVFGDFVGPHGASKDGRIFVGGAGGRRFKI